MKNFFDEFKTFISRGNVLDLAVGVIIGSAFNTIVNSLVNDIFMPLVGIVLGGINFTSLTITLGSASIKYGLFIQNIINFLVIAFCLFIFVKFMNKLNRKKAKEEAKEAPKPSEVVLLEEIRDLLKESK